MRPADSHLRPEELEMLLFKAADSRDGQADRALRADAEQHLSGCLVCQSRAEKYRKAEDDLNMLDAGRGNSVGGSLGSQGVECPGEEVWRLLAAGLLESDQTARYASHAATCDWCGKLLKESMEDMAKDVTQEERQALSELPIASAEWQSAMAKELSDRSQSFRERTLPEQPIIHATQRSASPARKSILRGWNLAWASAGLALLFMIFWFTWWRTETSKVNVLLAQAYTQQRKIELRMPWAGYGTLVVERGGGKQDLPGQFYTAEGIIKTQLAAHPKDPVWLQAQARAHLLEWKYEKALEEINEALNVRPDDPMLLQDRATAFFEQAEKSGLQSHIYYDDAVEDLSKILKANPNDPVALLNRAILYEKLQLLPDAIADLEKYLSLDPSGPWAEEARIRLQKLELLKKAHDDAFEEPLADPVTFLRLMGNPSSVARVDERIESYQDQAIRSWLPQAFPVSGPSSTEAFSALRALAELLAERHQDRWLNDLLDTAHASPEFASAIAELSEALSATVEGEAAKASSRAAQAAQLFQTAGNQAGALRSALEEVHGLRNSQQGEKCLLRANLLAKELAGRNDAWVRGQFQADWCSCLLMTGKFEQARVHSLHALDVSARSNYPILQMRSLGIAASIETDEGNILAAWAKDQEGLSKYWQSKYAPPLRAQQFYDDLTYFAENAGNLELALAFAGESVRMSFLSKDKNFEALARQHLARIAERTGRLSMAAGELEKSQKLLELLLSQPGVEANRPGMETNRVYALTGIAEIESSRGELKQAEKSLESIRSEVGQIHSFTVSRAFYKAYGELQLKESNLGGAEDAFEKAIHEADSYLGKLSRVSDRYDWVRENSALYRAFIQLELKKDPQKALVAWEWYRTAFDRSLADGLSLQKLLSESAPLTLPPSLLRQATLVYSLFPDSLAIWVVDEKGITPPVEVAVDSKRLKDSARQFLEMCGDPNSDLENLKAAGQSLFQTLLEPVASRLSGKTGLVVELDEDLGDIPFDALVTPNHQYLGEMYEITFSPGLLYGKDPKQVQPVSRDSRILAVGSTANIASPDASLDPLIDTPEEAANVARLFPKSTLLTKAHATVQSMETALPQAEIFHFAGHSISSARIEGLVIADQREKENATVWDATHIRRALVQNVRLAVLSACATGKSYKGRRGAQGELARAFLLAGVPNVVGSRWNVDSHWTGRLMEEFYTAVVSGHSISSSMQIAAFEMRNRPETRHPYYWAPFGVFGRS